MIRKVSVFFLVMIVFSYFTNAQCPEGSKIDTKNRVSNGDFSQGNYGFHSDYKFNKKTVFDEGTYSIVNSPKYIHQGFQDCDDHTTAGGLMLVINGSPVDDMVVWEQDVDVVPNTTYFFSTWICSMTDKGNIAKLQFSINGVKLGEPFEANEQSCRWNQFFTNWESGSATKAKISIVNKNTKKSGNDFALDDITFYPCLPFKLEGRLDKLNIGEAIELRNIFFKSGDFQIQPQSYPELNMVADFLTKNPKVEIEISGHTDNVGPDNANMSLSLDRARAVYEYLIGKVKGGDKRIKYIGYGKSMPVASNETLEGRQLNRRVEMKIVKK